MSGFGRKLGGALEKCSDSRRPASRLRTRCATLELGGNILVGARRCLRPVPYAPVGIELRLRRLRQGSVRFAPLARTGRAVDGRANEWMAEHDPKPDGQQTFCLDDVRGRLGDTEELGRTPQQRWVADRIRRGHDEQPLCVARERGQPPREALLDAGRQGKGLLQAEAARELRGRQPSRQLHDRERIAARLDDDPFQHLLVEPCRQDGIEEGPCIPTAERLDAKLGEALKRIDRLSRREDHRDPLGKETSRDEREHAGRRTVEPLRVVDDAECSGCSSAASDSRLRTASPTRNGFGARRELSPSATSSASPWGAGSRSIRWKLGELNCCSAAKASSISPSTPTERATRKSAAAPTALSSSAVLPTPASP